ncbi:MAG: ATPase [Candidatus Carbobacillus altaicus]|uniref:ATPase n=1 Tax=Candidatus Carbonibacillus altaicus TaxID=2163959 RepID=A0A2R6Y2Q3_9BACL|nr:MAG: ATPase [Candidatus Carbobacillus altaicus]
MIVLEARQIKHSIGDRELFTAERLYIAKRDRIGLIGRNGAGKTTLLNILAGKIQPEAGTVQIGATTALIPQLKPNLDNVSGGELTFQYIERAFGQEPGLLLADEPTMHLDLEHTTRLEELIRRFPGAIVVISHDRAFLDNVCTKIWAIEERKVTVYPGNYSFYAASRELAKRQQMERYEEYLEKKRHLEQAIRTRKQKAEQMVKAPKEQTSTEFRGGKPYFAKKQKGVHSTIKAMETRLAKLEKVEKPRELPAVKIDIPNAEVLRSKTCIRAERVSAAVPGRILWRDASFRIRSGEKVALLGPNGSGKTTLIRKILNGEPGFEIGSVVRFGYIDQNLEILDVDRSILDNVRESSPHDEVLIRTVLARLLFRREEVYKPVHVLSGGERVKVAFAKVFLSEMNVLLMDEPTNFLDIDSIEALESLLETYEGTVLFASHDRKFVERIATKIMEIRDARIHVFDGSYTEYLEHQRSENAAPNADEEELLRVETRLAEVIGKLAEANDSEKIELDAEFWRLAEQRNRLRNRV